MAKPQPNRTPFTVKCLRFLFKTVTPIAPKLMGRLAYTIWITPPRPPAHQMEMAIANKAKVSYVWVDGLRITVWTWGQGPAVLFIHGWGGRGTQVSSFVHELNKAGLSVISFDMPAHGQSDGKRTNAFSIATATSKIISQIENLHTVITHSFGGMIFAYCYQPTWPLQKIVMICPPSTVETPFHQFIDTLRLPPSVQNFILEKLNKKFGVDVFERLSLIRNAALIRQPVLLIHDKKDDIVPLQDTKDVAHVLQQSTFQETSGLGHIKILHDKSVIHSIRDFILQN